MPVDQKFLQLEEVSSSLESSGELEAAAALWDGFFLEESAVSPVHQPAETFYFALLRRVSIPLPLGLRVIEAAQRGVLSREGQLTQPQEADFYLLVATARFDIGQATFAERLHAYQTAVGATSAWQGLGLPPGRYVDQLGFLAMALTDIGAHEQASRELAGARALVGLTAIAPCDSVRADHAVERLIGGVNEPVLDLGETSLAPQVPVGEETVGWLRQLEAEIAAEQGDVDTSVCLYQALACYYAREGAALAITAADVLSRSSRARDACQLIEKVLDGDVDDGLLSAVVLAAARAHLAAGDRDRATTYYDRARTLLDAWPNIVLEPDLEVVAARLARARGDEAQATAHYVQALTAALERRAGRLSPELDDCAMRAVVGIADQAVEHCLDVADDWTLAWVTDIVKSARLAALLEVRDKDVVPGAPAPGSAAEQAALLRVVRRRQIEEARARIEKLNRLIANEGDPVARAALVEHLRIEREAREALLGEAVLEDGLWRSFAAAPPMLEPGSFTDDGLAVLSLYCRPGEVLSTLIMGGKCQTARMMVSESTTADLRRYVENLASATIEPAWRDPRALGLSVESFVSDELVEALLTARELVVVPHRDLHVLPWAMLRCREQRLIELVDVAQAPNISSLHGFPPLSSEPPRLATFCPTTGVTTQQLATSQEVNAVRAVAGELAVAPVAGEDADAAALVSLLVRPDVDAVHIASHGWASEQDPLGAGVVSDDGVFAQFDLFGVDTTVREVYASACLVGWRPSQLEPSQEMAADEGFGLFSAFAACGAAAMVASVTLVDDGSSVALASHYYQSRYSGETAFQAWCAAMRQMAASDLPPSAWCGYVYFGGVRQVDRIRPPTR